MISRASEHVLAGMGRLGLFRFSRFVHRRELLILTYHSVVDVELNAIDRCPFLYRNAVTAGQFRTQLDFLRNHYTLLDSAALLKTLNGTQTWPERAALITFDDGLRNNATVAASILEETNTAAIFFLPTAFLDKAHVPKLHWTETLAARAFDRPLRVLPILSEVAPEISQNNRPYESIVRDYISFLRTRPATERDERLRPLELSTVDPTLFPADRSGSSILYTMSWEEVKDLPACITLGSHGCSHASLSNLTQEEVQVELVASKRRIEERIGEECLLLAYPYGSRSDVSPSLYPLAQAAGYAAAFTQFPGLNEPDENPFSLKRINVPGTPSLASFRYHASGFHARRKRRSLR